MTYTKRETTEAIERLHEMVNPGDTLHTVLRHVSASGMTRDIDVFKFGDRDRGRLDKFWLSRLAAKAGDFNFNEKHEAVRIGGAGMDMGFHLVYSLSRALYPDGFACVGDYCPSNDHSNGQPKDLRSHHRDGGYALRQEWI